MTFKFTENEELPSVKTQGSKADASDFNEKPKKLWDRAQDSTKTCLEKIYKFLTCTPISMGVKIADGPMCGVELFYQPSTSDCVYWDLEAKCWKVYEGEVENCVEADVEECCSDAKPERFCISAQNLSGNGNVASTYTVVIGDTESALGADFTPEDIVTAIGNGAYLDADTNQICSINPIQFSYEGVAAIGEAPDIVLSPFKVAYAGLQYPAEPAVCKKFSRVYTKREDAILDAIVEGNSAVVDAINCQPQPTGWYISEGALCGLPLFYLPKQKAKVFYNCDTNTYEEPPMGIQTTPYKPTTDKTCAEAQFAAYELTPGATDVGTIVADILAANPQVFTVNGSEVPVTAEDIDFIKITPKACGTQTSAGEEVTLDFVNINGSAAENFVDLSDGGVAATTQVEVPAGGCALVDVCFKKCWSKEELAELG